MSEEHNRPNQSSNKSEIDPFTQMFKYYEMLSSSWAKVMSDSFANKTFAESMGEQIEGSLDAFSLIRRQYSDFVEQYLAQLNIPTHKDITNLAERLTKMEMDIDDLNDKIDQVLDILNGEEKS